MERIAAGIWKLRLGVPEKLTPVSLREDSLREEALMNLTKIETCPFKSEDIVFKKTNRGCVVEIPLAMTEKIYGFGLQFKSFDQTGKKKYLRTNADPSTDSGDSHAPVPFYASTGGYGVFIDTARYVTFYCGSSKKKSDLKADKSLKKSIANNIEELYAAKKFSEDRAMIAEIPCTGGIDIYFFAGPDIKTAVQRYNLFSGGGCIPPMWGLGIWYRGYGRFNREDVTCLAKKFREESIPCDVFGLEPGWQSHSYSCSYKWDETRFYDQNGFIEKMYEMSYKLNLWEHVFVHASSPIYENLKPFSADYEVWEGLVPDLSIKEAREIFASYHENELINKGIMGFKLDECDGSDFTGAWSFPNCSEFPSGMDGEQMHSVIGILYQRTLASIFRRKNLRTYGEVRSSHALASPQPFVLYSDLYEHRDFIRGLVNCGFSGLLWCPEVRQCDSVEDLVRRIQTVIFSPQALVNAWMIPNPPWYQYNCEKNLRNELMENRQQITELIRGLFELRMRFIPYIYSGFARYYFEGISPFRAVVMDYPEDEKTYSLDSEYMMGDSIIVAPMVAGENKRRIYLPKGNWYCFWTDIKYEGGNEFEIEVPLEKIPLFVKEGTLLPLAEPVQSINNDTCFEISVRCYGENCNEFHLYEDDGVSYDFEEGKYNLIRLKYSEGKVTCMRKGGYKKERYIIKNYYHIK